jgi:hypothetical protein
MRGSRKRRRRRRRSRRKGGEEVRLSSMNLIKFFLKKTSKKLMLCLA